MRLKPYSLLTGMVVGVLMPQRLALAGGGGGLPWEGPLEQIQQSITGPVAGAIALAAIAVTGAMLIFGGELNDFARRLVFIVLVAGILLGGAQIVSLFGAAGASIGVPSGTALAARANLS